jgi:DNA processing protein
VSGAGLSDLLTLLAAPGLRRNGLADALRGAGGAGPLIARLARDPERRAAMAGRETRQRVEHALRVIDKLRIRVITALDDEYPMKARPVEARPAVLFARGDVGLLARREAVAVVGTRRPTTAGLEAAEGLAAELARLDAVVVSGLARGIDGAAHRGALHAGGGTIAVLGCGIEIRYPREHARLQERVAEEGLLLSQFLPGDAPLPHHFLERNCTMAALSDAVVVVEGGNRSGALRTADAALELGRDVLAVPGAVGRTESEAPNLLLAQGARIALSAVDVLEEIRGLLPLRAAPPGIGSAASVETWHGHRQAEREQLRARRPLAAPPPPPPPADPWLAGLGREGRALDDLVTAFGGNAAQTAARLLELEIEGVVERLPGGRWRRAG